MPTVKERVCRLIRHMPADCTIEDIMQQLYVLQSAQHDLEDAEDLRYLRRSRKGALHFRKLEDFLAERGSRV